MFGNLVDKSLKRENVVGHITSGLGYELSQLADFLDKVERRRPKGDQTCKWFGLGVVFGILSIWDIIYIFVLYVYRIVLDTPVNKENETEDDVEESWPLTCLTWWLNAFCKYVS